MASTITAKYPFSGKSQCCLISEEIVATGVPQYGTLRTPTLAIAATPSGNYTWKSLGYITGGQTIEIRTMEEIGSIGHRNVQQLAEVKFECNGSLQMEVQNGRLFYFTLSSNNGTGAQTAPGVYHGDNTQIDKTGGTITGLTQHIFYEPEWVCVGTNAAPSVTSYVDGASPEIPSFNLLDAYSAASPGQPKVAKRYVGCKVNTLQLDFNKDGAIKANVDWMGAQVYPAQTKTGTLPISDYLQYEEIFPPVFGKLYLAAWTFPTGTTNPIWNLVLDGTTASGLRYTDNLLGDIQAASISISNSLEPLFVIGDTTARNMISQQRKYEGKLTMAFENEDMHTKFMGAWDNSYTENPADGVQGSWTNPYYAADREKYYAMKLFYDNSSVSGNTGTANYRRIEVTFLGVKFKSIGTPRAVNGIIYQDIDFQALMLAPYNSTDKVGGIVMYDRITAADFHSVNY